MQQHPYLKHCRPPQAHGFCWYSASGHCCCAMWQSALSVPTYSILWVWRDMDLNCNLCGVQRHATTGWQKVLRGDTVCSFLRKCFHISVCTRSPKAAAYSICVWWSGLWWFASNTHCQRVKMIHWRYCHCCILYIYALSLEIPTLQDYLSWQLGLNGRYILRVGTYSCIVSFFSDNCPVTLKTIGDWIYRKVPEREGQGSGN